MTNKEVKLEKKLSPLSVWALAFGCIIGWGAFVMPGNTFLGKAGPLGTAIGILLAACIMIVIAYNYDYMINIFPIAGGEFAYTKKTFGKKNAFVCAWFLGLSYGTLVPMNSTALALIGRNFLGKIFQFGYMYTILGYDIYIGEIFLALFAIVFFAILSIKGIKLAGNFQILLTGTLVTGVIIIAIAAILDSSISFLSLKPLYYPNKSKLSGILAILSVAPWAFVGFDTVPQSAEEFQFSHKKTKVIMIISIMFGAIIYIILNTVTASIIPAKYNTWVDYIDNIQNLNGITSLPTFNAAQQLLGNYGLIFLGVAVLSAILSGIIGFYMATSRLLYSMANENIIPKWFGKLHKKYKTPVNAIFFHMVISLFAPFFGRNALGWLVEMSSLGAAIGYGYTSLAALYYAKKEKNRTIIFTGIFGIVVSIIFLILLLIPIPGLDCSLGKEAYICLGGWILLGIIFYFYQN